MHQLMHSHALSTGSHASSTGEITVLSDLAESLEKVRHLLWFTVVVCNTINNL